MSLISLFKKSKSRSAPASRVLSFGKYSITLQADHMLDKYQQSYPLFDRFLPFFCADFSGFIVDIGANIGDTTVALFSTNDDCHIIGVEADAGFFKECDLNISRNNLQARFTGINKFVSTQKGHYKVIKSPRGATGSISNTASGEISVDSNTVSFSELMELIPPAQRARRFDLLKIDTDGYDWDILQSFYNYAKTSSTKPHYIFFEQQSYLNSELSAGPNRTDMTDRYQSALESLSEIGYDTFCLFDNYGTHIRITNSTSEIVEICKYISRSQTINRQSTIYYLDVLAFNSDNTSKVERKLSNFYQQHLPTSKPS